MADPTVWTLWGDSWNLKQLLTPASSLLVRCISFVCFVLGTFLLLPLLFFVGCDLFLWLWRHCWSMFPAPETAAPAERPTDVSSPTRATIANEAENPKARKRL
ncbi:hypothetical protein DCS_07074 [Drechmeria coniospora]|uniref:Uncharacterized protein n=1 Tax=Drechmeria coniospora TaxID=98403 RepID=A0A151GDC1_DRECN|nr:hypothetical protein DCS_07074 [Drechmeria coniospora]KYK55112.1 hypothetical protein DCS_07074 [Drechmeria coniospora]ODA82262.1 hypothetical protein RJ55_00769 [Drechmeria coniospora]